MSFYKVVIADDEQPIRHGLSLFPWEKYGFQLVCAAPNGQVALQAVRKYGADLLLSDIRMPVMDGLALARSLYEEENPVQIVLLTGFQDFAYAQQAIRYHVCRLLTKPLDPADLSECLQYVARTLAKNCPERKPPALSPDLPRPRRLNSRDTLSCPLPYPQRESQSFVQILFEEQALTVSETDILLDGLLEVFSPFLEYGLLPYCQALCSFLQELQSQIGRFPDQTSQLKDTIRQAEADVKAGHSALAVNQAVRTAVHRILQVRAINDFEPNRIAVEKAMEYIRQNYGEPLTLELVANSVHLSPSYLSVLFKKYAGTNFSKYLRDFRMEQARILLTQTHLKVYEVAQKVGYPNSKYFIDLFKEQNKVSPHEYRIFHGTGGVFS